MTNKANKIPHIDRPLFVKPESTAEGVVASFIKIDVTKKGAQPNGYTVSCRVNKPAGDGTRVEASQVISSGHSAEEAIHIARAHELRINKAPGWHIFEPHPEWRAASKETFNPAQSANVVQPEPFRQRQLELSHQTLQVG